jgi:hypothetical protein
MSHDRIAGMIWGFTIGFAVAASIFDNPYMIIFAFSAFGFSVWFAQHEAAVGSAPGSGK